MQLTSILYKSACLTFSQDIWLLYTLPKTQFQVEYRIMVADADGRNAQEVAMSGAYVPENREAAIFSPDGWSIIFSGNVPGES